MQNQGIVSAASAPAAVRELERLLHELEDNLQTLKLSLKQQQDALGQVKAFGRDLETARPIFTKQAISTLSRYGLDVPGPSGASHEALRCLANAFLLHEPARQIFVDLGYGPKAARRLKSENLDDEFLISRILFFLTYNTTLDFNALLSQDSLAESINKCMSRHAVYYTPSGTTRNVPREAAMSETLKLLFNITYHYPNCLSGFTPTVRPLITILRQHSLPEPPLQPPTSYLLNALLNLDLSTIQDEPPHDDVVQSRANSSSSDLEPLVNRLVEILDSAVRRHTERDFDQAAASLLTLLRRLYGLSPQHTKAAMRTLILPSADDREKPLGKNDTLSSRLLQLSCSPKLLTLGGNISALLFEMSDSDPNTFVQNIGYGFASGFLMSENLEVPQSALKADATSRAGEVSHVNPVTGQRWVAEDRDASSTTPMTEEEKEREAEKLFVLFERLKATGVVNVQNPVERRFEEVD